MSFSRSFRPSLVFFFFFFCPESPAFAGSVPPFGVLVTCVPSSSSSSARPRFPMPREVETRMLSAVHFCSAPQGDSHGNGGQTLLRAASAGNTRVVVVCTALSSLCTAGLPLSAAASLQVMLQMAESPASTPQNL